MRLRLLHSDLLRPDDLRPQAAAHGIEALVIAHLREKNGTTAPNPFGLPKTNYYAEAANDVSASTEGRKAVVTIDHPGLALHYEGGTVYPKKKALAIPIDPIVAGIWPSEYTGSGHSLFKTPGGALGDSETGRMLYILLPRATIPKDESVLPTDAQIYAAAEAAITEAMS